MPSSVPAAAEEAYGRPLAHTHHATRIHIAAGYDSAQSVTDSAYDPAPSTLPPPASPPAASPPTWSQQAESAAYGRPSAYDTRNVAEEGHVYASHRSLADGRVASVSAAVAPISASASSLRSVRAWEEEHVLQWAQRQMRRAAQTVHSAAQVIAPSNDAAVAPTPSSTPTSSSASSSSSSCWRLARSSYLRRYPPTPWNTLYQRLFEMVPGSSFEVARKQKQQEELLQRFTDFCRNVVELIMEEMHLPTDTEEEGEGGGERSGATGGSMPSARTKFLPPLQLGGLAGGEKYVMNGVLFKFARDWSGLFHGDDQCVQKSAASEIRHMNALIGYEGHLLQHAPLSLPLTCSFRIRGHVVMATALAPIQGRESLVYGSADAGREIRDGAENRRVESVIQELASSWNLAPHPVVDAEGRTHLLPLAADVELHASRVDGRLYMLDLARFLPPTPPSAASMEHLYYLLRPEFVKMNLVSPVSSSAAASSSASPPLPPPLLSADTFSGFGVLDHAQHSVAIHANMRHMKYGVMPLVAERLQKWWAQSDSQEQELTPTATQETSPSGNLTAAPTGIARIMHENGVNMRYLALVRSYLPTPGSCLPSPSSYSSRSSALPLSTLLLYELVARTLKHLYFGWVRRMMLLVGHTNERTTETQHSKSSHETASTLSSNTPLLGWTDADLERWMQREKGEVSKPAPVTSPSTLHQESSFLFSYLLFLLFAPPSLSEGRSASFFQHVLWPAVEHKFTRWRLGEEEQQRYAEECAARGQKAELREFRQPLLSQEDKRSFEQACASLSSSSPSSPPSISTFLHILLDAIGLDFPSLQHSLDRLGIQMHAPTDYVTQLLPAIAEWQMEEQVLTPRAAALIFLPSFRPAFNRVQPLPFLPLAQAEAQLLSSLSARTASLVSAGQDERAPALLSTLWALLTLYEVHRDDDYKEAAGHNAQTNVTGAGGTTATARACFEKGCAVLQQIERIFEHMRSSPYLSSEEAALVADQVNYAKFGWFYLKFGELQRAKEYFVKEHQFRQERVDQEGANQTLSVLPSADTLSLPPPSPSWLRLAQSLECMGIIERECGDHRASLQYFEKCLSVYQRVYGEEGMSMDEEEDKPQMDWRELLQAKKQGDPDPSVSCPSSSFRHSLELSTLLTNLANSYGAVGLLDRKRRFLERALAIVATHSEELVREAPEDSPPLPHPSLIGILTNLASCLAQAQTDTQQLTQAKEMLEQCLQWNRALHHTRQLKAAPQPREGSGADTSEDPSTLEFEDEPYSSASILTPLANLYGKLGSPARSVSLLTRSLSLLERQHGSQRLHPEVCVVLTNLGMAHARAGDIPQGLATLQRALAGKAQLYGTPLHPEVALTLTNLSVLYDMAGDLKMEMRSLRQAQQIYAACQLQQKEMTVASAQTETLTPPLSPTSPTSAGFAAGMQASLPPALLFVQTRLFRCQQRMRAEEDRLLSSGLCSYLATGANRTVRPWFRCLTCSPASSSPALGVCATCKERCHAGHQLQEQPSMPFYCDCGEGVLPQPCQALGQTQQQEKSSSGPAAPSAPSTPVAEHT